MSPIPWALWSEDWILAQFSLLRKKSAVRVLSAASIFEPKQVQVDVAKSWTNQHNRVIDVLFSQHL